MQRDRTRAEACRRDVHKLKGAIKSTGITRPQAQSAAAHDERGEYVDDGVLRARVRQRIQQRVLELQSRQMTAPEKPVAVEAPFMASLHQDVVQTAAQILGKYLANSYQSDEPLELALVHRMLVKEVELQALQQRRTQPS